MYSLAAPPSQRRGRVKTSKVHGRVCYNSSKAGGAADLFCYEGAYQYAQPVQHQSFKASSSTQVYIYTCTT